MTRYGGRKRFKFLVVSLFVVAGLVFGGYLLFKYEFKADSPSDVPTAPSGLEVTEPIDKNSSILIWNDNSSSETNYVIERSDDIANKDFSLLTTLGANTLTYTDNHNQAGKRYYYRVYAENAVGKSNYSEISSPTRTETRDYTISLGKMDEYSYHNDDSNSGFEVADGLRLYSTRQVSGYSDPSYFYAKKVTPSSGTGNAQEIGFKENVTLNSDGDYVYLYKDFTSSFFSSVSGGDTFHFDIGSIEYKNFVNSADAAYEKITLSNSCSEAPYKDYQHIYPDDSKELVSRGKPSSFSDSYTLPTFSNAERDYMIQNCNLRLTFTILVWANQATGSQPPSIVVDNISITKTKVAGGPDTVVVPVPKNRNIKTHMMFFHPSIDDLYWTAQNYDAVTDSDWPGDHHITAQLRYYNPNIKIFIYNTGPVISDNRSAPNKDEPSTSPIGFADAIVNHPDWFYEYPSGYTVISPPGDQRTLNISTGQEAYPWRKKDTLGADLNFVFGEDYQTGYYVRMKEADFQQEWAQATEKVLRDGRYDGVFIDNVVSMKVKGTRASAGPDVPGDIVADITSDETQSFVNFASEYFKNSVDGFEVMLNQCSAHYDTFPFSARFNPVWKNTTQNQNMFANSDEKTYFNAHKDLFPDNTFLNTPEIFFQEWAFFSSTPNFIGDRWAPQLVDMDLAEQYSKMDPKNKKMIFQNSYAYDMGQENNVDKPMKNPPTTPVELADINRYDNGWGRFAFTSFLLASNEQTYFGLASKKKFGPIGSWTIPFFVDPGYDLALKLGNPSGDGKRVDIDGDSDLKKRVFENGFVVVNGNPDTISKSFAMPSASLDEYGRSYAEGSIVDLLPHSGRIFFNITKLDQPTISSSRTQTYKESITLFGGADIFATSVTVNGLAATLDLVSHTWTSLVPLNIGSNNIVVTSKSSSVESRSEIAITRRKPADANADNIINKLDFSSLMFNWNKTEYANTADFNEDGIVNKLDFAALMFNWGK